MMSILSARRLASAAVILLLSVGPGFASAQLQVQKSASPSVQKSPVLTRTFNLSGQDREVIELEITAAGKLEAEAEWTGTADKVAIILNGPGQTQYYARKDGRSPLSIAFTFTERHLSKGDSWKLSVAVFGDGTAKGKVEVRLPGAAASGKARPGLSKSSPPSVSVGKSKSKTAPAISTAPAAIRVTAPTSRTELVAGEGCRVRWATTGPIEEVNLWMEYIDRTGQLTVMQLPGIGNDQIPNSGSKIIKIPDHWNSEHGERWRVKIAGGGVVGRSEDLAIARKAAPGQAQGQAQQGGGAASAGPATLKVLYPNGGEELISGHSYKILWQSTGDPGPLVLALTEGRDKPKGPVGTAAAGGGAPNEWGVLIARNVPNTGEYDWVATRTGFPITPCKLRVLRDSGEILDESDAQFMLAPYIELISTEIKVYNKQKKQNWLLRTLRAITTAGLSEAATVASGGMSAVKESIDHIKDDKDEGAKLKMGADIEVSFAVMQWGTRQINEKVLSRVTIRELPSRDAVEVLAHEAKLEGQLMYYIFKKSFKPNRPLFKPGRYLLEISIDPNHIVPEEAVFRDNNIKTIEFELVEAGSSPTAGVER
jgi:hypothetical protein